LPETGTVEVKTGEPDPAEPEQAVKTWNMILPVGAKPPDRVAVSDEDSPAVIVEGETKVVTLGLAGLTTRISPVAGHIVETGLLFAFPLYEAIQ